MSSPVILAIGGNPSARAISVNEGSNINIIAKTLHECYNNSDDVVALIELGDLSYLGRTLYPSASEDHSFESPQRGVTIAYHRDRGESKKIKSFRTLAELNEWQDSGVPVFLFSEEKWHVKFGNKYITLTEEMY